MKCNETLQSKSFMSTQMSTRKSTLTWLNVWTSKGQKQHVFFLTNLLIYKAKPFTENK